VPPLLATILTLQVRGMARSLKHTEIYGIRTQEHARGLAPDAEEYRDEVLQGSSDPSDRIDAARAGAKGEYISRKMIALLNSQFMGQGVQIQSVMIKSVQLPRDIREQMMEKTMIISQNAEQIMHHENEMQINRMDQEVQTRLQEFHEKQQREIATGEEKLNDAHVLLNDLIAQAERSKGNIEEDSRINIESILAQASLKEQRIRDNMHVELTNIETTAQKQAAEFHANTKLQTETLRNKAKITHETNMAKSNLLISKAEGKIAPWLDKKNKFQTQLRELEVHEKLAQNPDLIVNGSENDNVNLIIAADAILRDQGKDQNGRRKFIAEMALLTKGSSAFMPSVASETAIRPNYFV